MNPDLNLNHLTVFHAVARLLSFTRAARELHLTQPGVSKHVKDLEEYYGARLFDRLGRKVALTQAGRILFETTAEIFSRIDESKTRIEALVGLAGGKLNIGASNTIATYILPEMLVNFRRKHPGVEIRVETGLSRHVVDKVLSNDVELGFVGHYAHDRRLLAKPFVTDRMLLIASPEHRWAARKSRVQLTELAGEPFLISKEGSGTWRIVAGLMEKEGVALEKVMELGTTEAVKQAVGANLGVSILAQRVLSKELAAGLVKSIPLAIGEPRRDLYLATLDGRRLSAAAQAFLDLLAPRGGEGKGGGTCDAPSRVD